MNRIETLRFEEPIRRPTMNRNRRRPTMSRAKAPLETAPIDDADIEPDEDDERSGEISEDFGEELFDMDLKTAKCRSRVRDRAGGRDGTAAAGAAGPRSPGTSGRRGGGRFRGVPPLIQDEFKRGQEVIVQVIKEGIGTKGPTLSTYVSIAGRYLVHARTQPLASRKIQDEKLRRRCARSS